MLGAIAGDVIGSPWEHQRRKHRDFPLFTDDSRFTDDSVLTCAIAEARLDGGDYAAALVEWFQRYPYAGYGGSFVRWAVQGGGAPYHSWGNGSAMRVSPVAWLADSLEEAIAEAARSARVTHDHPEGVKGAEATAAAIWLARTGAGKDAIRETVTARFGYDLARPLDTLREEYVWDVSCAGSVPESIIAFLEAGSVEEAIRNAVSLGGDADTMACIAGSIAEAHFGGVPAPIASEVRRRLTEEMLDVLDRFEEAVRGR